MRAGKEFALVAPHYHTQDEYMTVIDGSLFVGLGRRVQTEEQMTFLPNGGAVSVTAYRRHYAYAREPMVMQIHALGPGDVHWVRDEL